MSKRTTGEVNHHDSKHMDRPTPVLLGDYYADESTFMSFDHSTAKLRKLKKSIAAITGVELTNENVEQIVAACFYVIVKKELDHYSDEAEKIRDRICYFTDKLKGAERDWYYFNDRIDSRLKQAEREHKRALRRIKHDAKITTKELAKVEAAHEKKVKELNKLHKAELIRLLESQKTVKLLLKHHVETGRDVRKLQI